LGMKDSICVHWISDISSRGVIVIKRYMTLWQSTSHFFIFEICSNDVHCRSNRLVCKKAQQLLLGLVRPD
jgi:hypothetical protein